MLMLGARKPWKMVSFLPCWEGVLANCSLRATRRSSTAARTWRTLGASRSEESSSSASASDEEPLAIWPEGGRTVLMVSCIPSASTSNSSSSSVAPRNSPGVRHAGGILPVLYASTPLSLSPSLNRAPSLPPSPSLYQIPPSLHRYLQISSPIAKMSECDATASLHFFILPRSDTECAHIAESPNSEFEKEVQFETGR
jgi:hypothetical protein